ncbi:MAG: hypothetical protein ACP5I1_18135, partial [Candidatus Hinthialibacter sp.]
MRMKFNRRELMTAAAGLLLLALHPAASKAQSTKMLFNGKDMSGWIAPRTPNEWMTAESVSLDPNDGKKFAIQ